MAMASQTFAPKPVAVADVRRWVRELLDRWALPVPTTEDAVLLCSELATNAVMHAGTPFDVTITVDGGVLRVAVSDDVHQLPAIPEHPTGEGGRGLRIVQALSLDWGAEPVPGDGKVVWFEVAS